MKKYMLLSLLFLTIAVSNAQVLETNPQEAADYVADKFPFTRLANAEFRYTSPYDYTSKLGDGTKLPKSSVQELYQSRLSTNINIINSDKWIFSTLLFYNYMHVKSETAGLAPQTNDFHYYGAGLSLTRFSTLFGKTAIYSASVVPTGGNDGFERVTGLASATLVLKADAKTKMTVGVMALIDPSSMVPSILTFSYERRFNSGWVLDVILPQRIFMKKDMFENGRLSLGTEMSTTTLYLNKFNNTGKTYMLSQVELLTGVTYEHNFRDNFIATFKTGFQYVPISRIAEVNKKFNDYIFSAQPDPSFYVNIGLSYKL